MNKCGRRKMSQRNVLFSIFGRIAGMITSFVGRSVFVNKLGAEYLGLGGFFGNIFSVISLCELGMGAAVAQSLYRPLAENDEYAVSGIVGFYSRFCKIISVVTVALSIAAVPILPRVVRTEIDGGQIICAYMLFVLNSAVSYLLAPKRMLVVCDQRMYVVTLARCVLSVLALVFQCAVLIVWQNYILYLVLRILMLCIEDIVINMYADKKYPFLALKMGVTPAYRKYLYSNVKALVWHKIGGVLSRSTDSLLLTYFVGLSGMGKYSNYALVIGTVGAFFDVAINSFSASVGNLGACDRGKKSEDIMRKMYFMNFWLLTVGTCVIVAVLNPVIELWLGEDMLFSDAGMLVIVASFYLSCIRDPVQIFVTNYGLFRQSRHIPVLRAAANFVLSVFFVSKMGVVGVFLGTALSTALVPLWLEVRVLYKHGFSLDMGEFFEEMLCYIAVSALCTAACFFITYGMSTSFSGIALRTVTAFCVSNALLIVFSGKSGYFCEMKKAMRNVIKKKSKL